MRLVSNQLTSLHSDWLRPYLYDFDFLFLDQKYHYKKGDCLYTNIINEVVYHWRDMGRKVIVDHLWEQPIHVDGVYNLSCSMWFWLNESLWYRHLRYDSYVPSPNIRYRALMPVRQIKPARDYILGLLHHHLDQFVWSYQQRGKSLPGDQSTFDDFTAQRKFLAEWYDSTAFSFVLESSMNPDMGPDITEKTFKPMAFSHAFVVAGKPGTLARLREWGFVTFPTLFDESYDTIDNWRLRARAVVNTALACTYPYQDRSAQQAIEHNRARFYDTVTVERLLHQHIIEPICDYIQT